MKTYGFKAGLTACIAALACGGSALAGPEPYIGQIVGVGENFCPRGYMSAAGQTLQVSSNTALFSLIGCQYGGDCRTTFALPDLRGRAMISAGSGPGLPTYSEGERGGNTATTITRTQMPAHSHNLVGSTNSGTFDTPAGHALPTYPNPAAEAYADQPPGTATLLAGVVTNTGLGQAINIVQPSIAINYCIATIGVFPPRS
jgi:microcystin-dependent protein